MLQVVYPTTVEPSTDFANDLRVSPGTRIEEVSESNHITLPTGRTSPPWHKLYGTASGSQLGAAGNGCSFIDNGARRTANTGTQGSRPSGARLPHDTCLGQLESRQATNWQRSAYGRAMHTPRAEPRERTATSADCEKNRQLAAILSRQSFSIFSTT